ncbi:MAG: AAA family ATPase [Sedimentisphaerales bacterium]|nr:AAA family ATPase [Sedimentisphaerales bacterium]
MNTAQPQSWNRPKPFRPFEVMMRRRWQLFSCLLLVCGVAFATTVMRKPKYQSTARVEVVTDQPQMGPGGSRGVFGGGMGGDYFSTQCQLLQSPHVLSRAAENLNMSGGHWVYSEAGIKQLRDNVKIKPVPSSRLIDIVGTALEPAKSAAIANQVTAAFIEISMEARRATNKRIIERVNQQISDYDRQIQQQQQAINQYRQDNLITGNHSSLATIESRINTIESELTQIQMNRLELENHRALLKNHLSGNAGLETEETTLDEINNDEFVAELRRKLRDSRDQEEQLARVYLPGHQKLRNARVQIASLETQLIDRKQTLLQKLYEKTAEEYSATVKHEQSLNALLTQQKTLGVTQTQTDQQYANLLSNLKILQQTRDNRVARVKQFELDEGMRESPVVVIAAARKPIHPAGLSKSRQIASILLLGVLFSISFIFALERISAENTQPSPFGEPVYTNTPGPMYWNGGMWPGMQPVYPTNTSCTTTASQQSTATTATATTAIENPVHEIDTAIVLGKLDAMALGGQSAGNMAFAGRCRIVHTDQSCAQAETLRDISFNLLSRFGQTQQNIVITGITPQSGKTTCATNLAMLLARAGKNVLLVDANPLQADLHKVFSQNENCPGLQKVLSDISLLDQALQQTDIPNLTAMHWDSNDQSWDQSENANLPQLVQQLKQRFDWVIYDSGNTHLIFTRNLLQAVGKSISVVAATGGKLKSAQAVEQVELCGAVSLGVIENCPAGIGSNNSTIDSQLTNS